MKEIITISNLTSNSVSILKQKFTEDTDEQVGSNWRKAYVNSERGRKNVSDELPSPQQDAIFTVWGDEPTVIEGSE
ncbi:hypothetical protein [Salibacterium aidingense]|uniref:hypothetical protein n=1 Tax=Salibacterium aidingense TaxID=384933 RepID=UPI00040EE0A7|nr:hypothetical protein [Salibacterium aidingense]